MSTVKKVNLFIRISDTSLQDLSTFCRFNLKEGRLAEEATPAEPRFRYALYEDRHRGRRSNSRLLLSRA